MHVRTVLSHFFFASGFVSVDPEREEELQARQVPQLEARPQRLSNHVHRLENGKAGSIHE